VAAREAHQPVPAATQDAVPHDRLGHVVSATRDVAARPGKPR
jgi:hypothetical protein